VEREVRRKVRIRALSDPVEGREHVSQMPKAGNTRGYAKAKSIMLEL